QFDRAESALAFFNGLLSPVPARKPLWRLVSSEKPPFCRTLPGASSRPVRGDDSSAENPFDKSKSSGLPMLTAASNSNPALR
ncbi:hypothetical protein, partial [Azotobacter beijerinckii]|uniref:hypothetical protein n=1 Tax=Azotobacter beijerinckii TaxID=170623 RepID=UPI001B8BE991